MCRSQARGRRRAGAQAPRYHPACHAVGVAARYGCDGPTRSVLLAAETCRLFFRRLPGDGRIDAVQAILRLAASWTITARRLRRRSAEPSAFEVDELVCRHQQRTVTTPQLRVLVEESAVEAVRVGSAQNEVAAEAIEMRLSMWKYVVIEMVPDGTIPRRRKTRGKKTSDNAVIAGKSIGRCARRAPTVWSSTTARSPRCHRRTSLRQNACRTSEPNRQVLAIGTGDLLRGPLPATSPGCQTRCRGGSRTPPWPSS